MTDSRFIALVSRHTLQRQTVSKMNEQTDDNELNTAHATCAECVHTFRSKEDHNIVVCVPHIKTMPADFCDVCPLHRSKEKES